MAKDETGRLSGYGRHRDKREKRIQNKIRLAWIEADADEEEDWAFPASYYEDEEGDEDGTD